MSDPNLIPTASFSTGQKEGKKAGSGKVKTCSKFQCRTRAQSHTHSQRGLGIGEERRGEEFREDWG